MKTNRTSMSFAKFRRWAAFCFVIGLGLFGQAVAQTGNMGTIAGRVSNESTGDFLLGAIIRIEGTSLSTTTDATGFYTLQVPAGKHMMSVSYTGLDTDQQAVLVEAGRSLVKDVALNSGIYKLETFVVKSIREGTAAAIQNQRQAVNVKNVAAIDAFGNPGAAVGELLQRLPGISVDIGGDGSAAGIMIRGMSQDFGSTLVDGNAMATSGGTSVAKVNVYPGLVSTSNIASLELVKAVTPDMDGNAISGLINLKTKRAFERTPGRYITATAGTIYTDGGQHKSLPGKDPADLDVVSFNYSEVFSLFGRANNLGVTASLNLSHGHNVVYELGPQLAAGANVAYVVPGLTAPNAYQPLVRGWSAGHWDVTSKTSWSKNLFLNVDYKVNDDTIIYTKSTYGLYRADSGVTPAYFRWRLDAPQNVTSFTPDSNYNVVTTAQVAGRDVGNVTLNTSLYNRQGESISFISGVERKFLARTALLTVEANYSGNRTSYPSVSDLWATSINPVGFRIDRRGRDEWYPAVTQISGPSWSDSANYRLRPNVSTTTSTSTPLQRYSYSAPAERWGFRVDYKQELPDFIVPASYKIGVKQDISQIRQHRDQRYYSYAGSATDITPYVGYNALMMSKGNYGPFPMLQVPASGLKNDVWAGGSNWTQSASDVYNTVYQTIANDATTRDRYTAAYVMGQAKINHLQILAGVRFENTTIKVANPAFALANAAVVDGNTNLPATTVADNAARAVRAFRGWYYSNSDYNNLFPHLHFVYDLSSSTKLRASYNQTISRPIATLLLPNVRVTSEANRTLSSGNPDLKPWVSQNFEISAEKYFEPIGQFSVGCFLKEISNYYATFTSTVKEGPNNGFNGDFAGWTTSQARNIGFARMRGVEVNYQQQYTFLPGFWRGFGTMANYTYLQTYGNYGGITTVTRLANFTPHSANAGISYKGRGLGVQILANYRGDYYKSTLAAGSGTGGVSLAGQAFDQFQQPRLRVDVKLQYDLTRVFSLYLDIYNITDELNSTQYTRAFGMDMPQYAQGTGRIFQAGVTARF